MKKLISGLVLLILLLPLGNPAIGGSCKDSQDTYSSYDNTVSVNQIKNIPSEYYVLSYSWAPRHCSKVPGKRKMPGKKDYLQCGSSMRFGYILHGLWPQGAINKPGIYPRACEGDQPKISRKILEKYLCMTPSVWLLQHEYEYHGTCMHDEALESPEIYFSIAMDLHSQLKLPEKELQYSKESIDWFVMNNPHLSEESIQYYHRGKEWQFCYDNNFNVMPCPKSVK